MRRASAEFLKFAAVGTVGFLVDSTILQVLVTFGGAGLYASRVCSYLGAATTTWFLNRHFTFGGAKSSTAGRQWGRFVLVNGLGGILNYGTYASLVGSGDIFAMYPVAAVGVGSLVGLLFNFSASRKFVFRQ